MQPPTLEPNLRRLRAFVGVVREGSVHRAADLLHLTQPTVTRAIQKLERDIGQPLFERTSTGMTATAIGLAAARRAQRALGYLQAAADELARMPEATAGCAPRIAHALTSRHLQALIALSDHGTQSAAAAALSLSQPAITQALSDLERLVGTPLLLRTSRGMAATAAGEVLLRRGKLALAEIDACASDIAAHLGTITGTVAVGVLPICGTLLVPRAVNRLLRDHPHLRIVLVDGPYDTLLHKLRDGRLDVIVGPLRPPSPAGDTRQEALFEGALSVIARQGHPLAARRGLTLAELSRCEWVLPARETPARAIIERVMARAGLPMPDNPVEANALATLRALLMESDRLAMISRHQIYFEERGGMLAVLPIDLPDTARAIGMTVRADAHPPAGVQSLLEHLRVAAREPLLAGSGAVQPPAGISSR
ncbi:LysR family transcriptional regulator [Bordetella sp. H567]|uniref:LysR family transcriptional regulator n=1 Tax=Bordetella sp. H567 TaxID=1697043 RepID=UPI001314B28A|nr:LysR family transcriptional regulator [Bordetella sp. H567]